MTKQNKFSSDSSPAPVRLTRPRAELAGLIEAQIQRGKGLLAAREVQSQAAVEVWLEEYKRWQAFVSRLFETSFSTSDTQTRFRASRGGSTLKLTPPTYQQRVAEYQRDLRKQIGFVEGILEQLPLIPDFDTQPPTFPANASRPGRVFIGHGHSLVWLQLKDLLSDRLHLPYDEFNRESTAGLSHKERLLAMLEGCSFAFLVMTAEEERADGTIQTRSNVIHEAGLFQGRHGFERAIVVLEESCVEFSNIQGVGQIRFPRGNIGAASEEIRRVLEREGLLRVQK